eukprot:1393086-Pyramimonas_sp.AAC.1
MASVCCRGNGFFVLLSALGAPLRTGGEARDRGRNGEARQEERQGERAEGGSGRAAHGRSSTLETQSLETPQ